MKKPSPPNKYLAHGEKRDTMKKLRHWIIKLLAGKKTVVMLNFSICVPEELGKPTLYLDSSDVCGYIESIVTSTEVFESDACKGVVSNVDPLATRTSQEFS